MRRIIIAACLSILLLYFLFWAAASIAQAQVYRYVDEKGTTHFTDNPQKSGYRALKGFAEFWASKDSDKYHYSSCKWSQKISLSNLIKFSSPEKAREAGYVPCRVCNPPLPLRPEMGSETRNFPKSEKDVQQIYCTQVTDGDTIVVNMNGKKEKIRLIGVNTPETRDPRKPVEYFGKEASLFTRNTVLGKEVRLEFDQRKRDKHRRLLAYVYLTDGTFLNAEIIRQGYGFAYAVYPFKYMEEFRKLEKEARENNRGLWK